MTSTFRAFSHGLAAIAALGIAGGACAQSSQAGLSRDIGDSSAKADKSFIDLSIGRSTYNTSCGSVAGLSCSRGTTSYSLTAGNMITDNLGVELSAMNFGNTDRAGGSVSARGLNLAAVGRVPLGQSFGIEGKVGPTFGVTKVSVPVSSGIPSGKEHGLGLGYGVALDMNIVRGLRGSVGWEQHDFKFAGQGRSTVSDVTLALGYTF